MKFICIIAEILLISHAIFIFNKLRFEPMWKWAFRFLNAIRRETLRMNFFRWILYQVSIANPNPRANISRIAVDETQVRNERAEAGLLSYRNLPTAQRRHFAFEINYSLLVRRSADDNLLSSCANLDEDFSLRLKLSCDLNDTREILSFARHHRGRPGPWLS